MIGLQSTYPKNKVKVAVLKQCEENLFAKINKLDKLTSSQMGKESFGTKDYLNNMNISDASKVEISVKNSNGQCKI